MLSRRGFFATLFGIAFAVPNARALWVKNVEYIPVSKLAQLCGMRYKTTVAKKSQTVFGKTSRMTFETNSRAMDLNGITVWLGHAVVESKGMLYVAKRDYFKSIIPILFPQNNGTPPKLFHIFIDAGHGGKDRGAYNKTYKLSEKAVSLDIALRLGRELKKNGYKVSYSRTRDEFIELADRPKKANALRADLMVSIHCNAAAPSVSRIETFALTPRAMPSTTSRGVSKSDHVAYDGHSNDEWNQLLAYYIQRSLHYTTRSPDRGVKRARFAVLKSPKMPATLVECGFISNNYECKNMATAAYRQRIATTIANAIMNYHATLRRLSAKR